MASSTVRLSAKAHSALRQLAAGEDTALQTVLERAIESYRRQRFLEAANRQYAALRADTEAWETELAERSEWDVASSELPE